MIKITLAVFKKNWKEYLWSAFVTFTGAFIFSLAFIFKEADLDAIVSSGFTGGFAMLGRFIWKAMLEAFKEFLLWSVQKLKS